MHNFFLVGARTKTKHVSESSFRVLLDSRGPQVNMTDLHEENYFFSFCVSGKMKKSEKRTLLSFLHALS